MSVGNGEWAWHSVGSCRRNSWISPSGGGRRIIASVSLAWEAQGHLIFRKFRSGCKIHERSLSVTPGHP